MPEITSSVLMVTREMSGDRRYGLGRSLMPLVDALTNQGWRVRYLCQEDLPASAKATRQKWVARLGRLPWIGKVGHRRQLLAALAERLQMGWFAAKTGRLGAYAVVHLHDPWLAFGFWVGTILLRWTPERWGVTQHGFGSYSRATHEDGLTQGSRMQRSLRRLEAFTLARASWVTAPTQLALDQLARDLALPFNPAQWHAIAHAASANFSSTSDRQLARAKLGWDRDAICVLGVGRLVPLKRFDLLVSAFARLAARHALLQLHLLGEGDRAGLQHIADTAGCGDRIHFAVTDDVQAYLAAADIYVSTSLTESFGLANFEALLAGLPCICTAVGGVPEVMGRGAWLIPVDGQVLAAAMDELISVPEQRRTFSARATAQAKEAPKLDEVMERYVQLYLG